MNIPLPPGAVVICSWFILCFVWYFGFYLGSRIRGRAIPWQKMKRGKYFVYHRTNHGLAIVSQCLKTHPLSTAKTSGPELLVKLPISESIGLVVRDYILIGENESGLPTFAVEKQYQEKGVLS